MNSAAANNNKPAVNPWLVAVVVSIATFMEVLDTTITNVSLSHIAGSLAASQDESTWVLTSYLVANGIVLPLSGWLSDLMGRKKFFMLCIAGFTISSFACGASNSLEMLIFFRLIQGLAGGGLQPTQQAIIVDVFPPEKRGAVFGLTGITLIAAPIIGPTLGGWITDNFSWRWIFFINVPVGIFALLMVNRLLHEPVTELKKKKNIDYIGLGLIVIGLGAMQIMLDKGQQKDWFGSNMIVTVALISFLAITSAIFWLLSREDPVVDLRLLKDRGFFLACLLIFSTGFVLYGSSALIPLLVQTQYGYDALTAGLVISPGGLVIILLMPVAGKLLSKVQARYLVMTGTALCAFGQFFSMMHITPTTDYNTLVWMRVTQVIGLPFLFIPISTIAFAKIPREKNNKASALYALSRNLGGSVGIALVATFVSRYAQVHQNYLAGHLVPGDTIYESKMAAIKNAALNIGYSDLQSTALANYTTYANLMKQSNVMAYSGAFGCLFTVMVISVILACFLPHNRPKAGGPGAAAAH